MLISPPFLPDAQSTSATDAFIEQMMLRSERGAFPVSRILGWHGGVHLKAPVDGTSKGSPARAIADGTVKLVVQPKPMQIVPPGTPGHPLNYYGGWTDNGCVVIEHKTQIGENVEVTFYSIYQHLHQIADGVVAGQAIWRKDPVGQAGYIYGTPHRLHFEVVCDDANLARLVGRSTGALDTSKDGRTDALFGDTYVRMPAGAAVYDQDPQMRPHGVTSRVVTHTTEDTYVGIYWHGVAIVTSYVQGEGPHDWLQHALREEAAEYDLYEQAKRRFPCGISAGYELLRWGRVVSTGVSLAAGETAHWRKIAYREGSAWKEGYVDLNAPGTTKYSDADFPQWRGWTLVADDTDGDSRCDSATIKDLILTEGKTRYPDDALQARVRLTEVQQKLAKVIGKFPTEWEPGTSEKRWGWLKTNDAVTVGDLPAPLTTESFALLQAHDDALSFFQGLGFDATHWHFDPIEFVKLFKRCGWLSLKEMQQTLPRNSGSNAAGTIPWLETVTRLERGQTTTHPLRQVPPGMWLRINTALRAYGITDDLRRAHFLAQGFQETVVLSLLHERGSDEYFERYMRDPVKEWLGNTEAGDGARFKGRGLLHLTGRAHYHNYGTFCNRNLTTDATAPLLQSEAQVACDSGGWFWTMGNSGRGDPMQRADQGASIGNVAEVTQAVNGGQNGLANRQAYFVYLWHLFRDAPNAPVEGMPILQKLQRP